MHELAVCQSIIDQIETLALTHRAARVLRAEVAVGPLSGVEPALLARAFPLASAGSVADGATLSISTPALRVHCDRCDKTSEVRSNRLVCGSCGDFRTRLISGDELLLLRVEFDRIQPETAAMRAEETHHV